MCTWARPDVGGGVFRVHRDGLPVGGSRAAVVAPGAVQIAQGLVRVGVAGVGLDGALEGPAGGGRVVEAVVAQTQVVERPGVLGVQLQGFPEGGDGLLVLALAIKGQGRVLVQDGQLGGDAVAEHAQSPRSLQGVNGAVVLLQLGVGLAQEVEGLGVGAVDGRGVLELDGGVAVVPGLEQLVADAVVLEGLLPDVLGGVRTDVIEALGMDLAGMDRGDQGECEEVVVSQARGSSLI